MPYPYKLDDINRRAAQDPSGFAQESEAIFNRKVHEAAAMIAERMSASRVVLLSGPSGSGKTTTAKKLCDALSGIGINAHTVSLDKYFTTVDPETAPKTSDGEIDRESPYCLDLDMLTEHFAMLDRGEEVPVPHFNFKTQARDPAKVSPLRVANGEVAIYEGIHALNDMLAGSRTNAFKLYISARSDIVADGGGVCFKRTWTRLLRRVVRDELFRGTDASATLGMWANVRRGEKLYISPFKHRADLLFDSSVQYEIPVLKHFAVKAFSDIPEGTERIDELHALLPELMRFGDIDVSHVPPDSVLREFIGGGIYEY